jgi:hypothetical protein
MPSSAGETYASPVLWVCYHETPTAAIRTLRILRHIQHICGMLAETHHTIDIVSLRSSSNMGRGTRALRWRFLHVQHPGRLLLGRDGMIWGPNGRSMVDRG